MTFSIAGICPRTGEIGGALCTSSMAAGPRAMFVSPDHGVVFAQARSDPALGAFALTRLEAGRTAEETLADMLAATPHAQWRQLAVLDRQGRVAEKSGERTLQSKGAAIGEGAVAIGNAVANDGVVPAILEGFRKDPGLPLAERLIMALEYGARAGGEPYPLRSSALKVGRRGIPFAVIDLRVDLATDPIAELRQHWVMFQPMVEGYLQRTLDPDNAPAAADIEGHLHR
jgi:uncharacterized Ntn-hydrolase superfamily protein